MSRLWQTRKVKPTLRSQSLACRAILSAALILSAGLTGACRPRSRVYDNVVLVTIDTLRRDHLGAYGYPLDTSPFLDHLAERGALFDQAISTSSLTGPSHASILTSRYPYEHGVVVNGVKIAPSIRTLAEDFAAAGFATAAYVSVQQLESVSRGFATVDTPEDEGSRGGDRKAAGRFRLADVTVARASRWIDQRTPGERFFLWVHLFDVHESRGYDDIPASFAQKLSVQRREMLPAYFLLAQDRFGVALRAQSPLLSRLLIYDAKIAYVDAALKRLFDFVDGQKFGAKTLWVVTADHGEGLMSHGYYGHGRYLYQEQVHVPLIFYGRDVPWAGRRIPNLVRHVDLLPTLEQFAGLPAVAGEGHHGQSLVPLLRGSRGAFSSPPAFSERRPRDNSHKRKDWEPGLVIAAQAGGIKYIWHQFGQDEIYDLRNDPLELTSRVGPLPAEARKLKRFLHGQARAIEATGLHTNPPREEQKYRKELEALGYL